jgi:hypothetical protein
MAKGKRRQCKHCPTVLNSYNESGVCGPCAYERAFDWLREQQARNARLDGDFKERMARAQARSRERAARSYQQRRGSR